uniref:Receptor-type tyrosine-protein phosphatase-like N n=1 Tax=Denticeps clupeoides TaxID=299321 RepID=A0AAY4CDV4_9TELE
MAGSRHLRLWRVVCLLTVTYQLGLSSRYGCLFEKKLCSREQFCSDDRLFGQCLSSRQEQVQYQVSVKVLQRLQEVLKELMLQGLSWQDDITQYIIAKELGGLFHIMHKYKVSSDSMSLDRHSGCMSVLQHGYQDDRERSPPPLGDVAYPHPHPRPSLRPGGQKKERERERQLLQDLLSLYLSSAQPSFRHRGAAALPAAPFYEDLDLLQDYTDDYSLPEQPPGRQRAPHKAAHVQDYSSLSGLDGETELVDAVSQQGSRSSSAPPHPITPAPSAPLAPTSGAAGTPPGPVVPIMLADLQAKAESAGLGGSRVREEYGYIVTNQSQLSLSDGVRLLQALAERIHLATSSFINISVVGPALTFRIRQNSQNVSAEEVANKAVAERNFLEGETGLKIVQTGVGEATRVGDSSRGVVLGLVAMACVGGVLVAALAVTCVRHHARQLEARKLGLGPEGGTETHFDYQELCRQHMAAKTSFSRPEAGGRRGTDTSRVSSVSSQFSDGPQHSPSSHSSTPSWSEEPAQSNMDISTGHMILAYMEDHLKNKDRLQKEWEALCSYQAEPSSVSVARGDGNVEKNRYPDFVPYDHSRVKMKAENNPSREDYINASTIIDHDPRMPAYIATQGPLPHTISDFWQMVWENGSTVIVMITALVEDGEKMCERYWPDEGSSLYNIYEVNLVSEHIWCKDFLVRSFYLKNVQTQETRTLTQFHLLSWPAQGIPTSTRPMLDFRRKVNKCYRGRSCPIIVHCSDGTGRSGTYMLIDMVLNRMAKGVKEIDIAATLEHIRDQRPNMVRTKEQFEFALTAVAEEVNAILKALPQ